MSNEVMAECLQEAAALWSDLLSDTRIIFEGNHRGFTESDKLSIATLAASLYLEKEEERRFATRMATGQ